MNPAKGASATRWLRLGLLAACLSAFAACASTFPDWKPDRCHRSQGTRDTLNWDLFCRESP